MLLDFSFASLVASMFVSGAGFVLYKFGRKRNRPVFFIFGITMMVYPYVVSDVYWMVGIAVAMGVILYFLKKMGY